MSEADRAMERDTEPMADALQLLEQALTELDRCRAPADIGAYVDHAIGRLRGMLQDSRAS